MSKVAVVILNYNGKDFLQQFLPGVIQHSTGHGIYVIDNASTDDSVSYLEAQHPEVGLIRLDQNLGYAGGYNAGLKSIEEDLLVLLNSDIEVTPNWLDPISSLFEKEADCAACQPKIRSYHQRDQFEYAGASGGHLDWLGYPFCRGRIFECVENDQGQYDDITEIFWASGACLCIRKSIFEASGGFDEHFFAHMEEIDLCWRINQLGYKVMACPQSTVYHVGGGTLPVTSPRKTLLNFRNSMEMLGKNLPWWQLYYIIPFRWFLDWAVIFRFLARGEGGHAIAVIRAHGAFIVDLPRTLSQRSTIRNHPLIYKKSIVWDYFLRGKRFFSQLSVD